MSFIVPALADCDPGIAPTEFQVLLIMGEKPEKTTGGVFLTDDAKDRENFRSARARLVAVSPHAFSYVADWSDARKPRPGDEVVTGKYPGDEVTGRDGKTYRICTDRDVKAVVEGA
jgi:co-chaperonin GroES (HSP10)